MMFGKLEQKLEQALTRAEALVDRLGAFLPEPPPPQNWQSIAY